MSSTGLIALALAAILVATSGCGSSETLARRELIAKADPICKRTNEKFHSSGISPENVGRLGPALATYEKQSAAELAKLAPPASMDKEWKVIVQGFQTTGESLVKIAAYANAKNYVAARPDIGRLTNAQHNRAVAALHNGFKECSVY